MTGVTPRTVIGCFSYAFTVAGFVVVGFALAVEGETENAGLAGAFGLALAALGPLVHRLLSWKIRRTARERASERYDRGLFEARVTDSTVALRECGDPDGTEELVLEPGARSVALAVFTGFFATLWCGLAIALWGSAEDAPPLWFVGAFGAAGLVFLVWFLRRLWLVLRPRPRVTIEHRRLVPGASARIRFAFAEGGAPEKLVLRLVEQRLVERSSGKRSGPTIEVEEKRSILLGEGHGRTECAAGETLLFVPDDARPSRESAHSALRWMLVVEGRYPLAPDLRDEFVLWVHAR